VAGEGLNLEVSDNPLVIGIDNMMDLPFRGWKAIMSAGTASIGIFEGLYYDHPNGDD